MTLMYDEARGWKPAANVLYLHQKLKLTAWRCWIAWHGGSLVLMHHCGFRRYPLYRVRAWSGRWVTDLILVPNVSQ